MAGSSGGKSCWALSIEDVRQMTTAGGRTREQAAQDPEKVMVIIRHSQNLSEEIIRCSVKDGVLIGHERDQESQCRFSQ